MRYTIALCYSIGLLSGPLACEDSTIVERETTPGRPSTVLDPAEGSNAVAGTSSDEFIERMGLPVGSVCDTPYQCSTLICFAELDAESGICTQPCTNEPEECGAGLECRAYVGYGSICVSMAEEETTRDMEPREETDMSPSEPDMGPVETDMTLMACESREVYFTNTGGVELGRVTLDMPGQSEEVALSSLSGRTNRARVTYDTKCAEISVELLERYPQLCFDFTGEPCDRIPDINCGSGINWHVNELQTMLSEANNLCVLTPEEQGWTQYHTDIESCYPIYNGPLVDRFDVGRYNFPLCNDSVRGQHWCISVPDGSPSRCLGCEVQLYTCQ